MRAFVYAVPRVRFLVSSGISPNQTQMVGVESASEVFAAHLLEFLWEPYGSKVCSYDHSTFAVSGSILSPASVRIASHRLVFTQRRKICIMIALLVSMVMMEPLL
jgi:hypothetical protein